MYDILVLAQGMYDKDQILPLPSRVRTMAAIKWIHENNVADKSIIYFTAYKPPNYLKTEPSLAEVMRDFVKEIYTGEVVALTSSCNFTTKGEVSKFLQVSRERPVIVSGSYHLLRIFFYLWEARGLTYARRAIYVTATRDRINLRQWVTELIKILLVILLPESLQLKLEYWYAKRTHTLLVSQFIN